MDKTLEKAFHKIGQFHMANKYLKRFTMLLIIRCELKLKLVFLYTPKWLTLNGQ